MPTPEEIAVLRSNVVGAVGDGSTLSFLGQKANAFSDAASIGADLTLEDKGAVFLMAMFNEYFSVASDRSVYQFALQQVNGFVDAEARRGGRAWGLVRSGLLEIGAQHGWSTADTLWDDWTPDKRDEFVSMIKSEVGKQRTGCFVATAVYGSYEAPPVRTLRRFRDERLARSRGGRTFVRVYYALSPVLARHIRPDSVTGRIVRNSLDRIVRQLDDRGYSDRRKSA